MHVLLLCVFQCSYLIICCYSGLPREILQAQISGVAEALANLTERDAVDPVIKATVTLSESGFISVKEAVAYGEIKPSLTGV